MHKISLYKRVSQNDFVAKENALTVNWVNKSHISYFHSDNKVK